MEHNISTMEEDRDDTDRDFVPSTDVQNWNFFGYAIPKQEVVFFCQVITLYIIIIICLVEIIINQEGSGCKIKDHDIWYSLLAGAIGYLLPNPSLDKQ
jgi:hypothetical protein